LQRQQAKNNFQEETPEWITVPSTHLFFKTAEQTESLEHVSQEGKNLNSKAIVCLWTGTDKRRKTSGTNANLDVRIELDCQ
jgi:hypothetical protein